MKHKDEDVSQWKILALEGIMVFVLEVAFDFRNLPWSSVNGFFDSLLPGGGRCNRIISQSSCRRDGSLS
jgi:hypothetical protein